MSPAYLALHSGVSRNRSGMKESGSEKLDAECAAPQEDTQTEVFSGTAWPSIREPPLGTLRKRPIGTGGKIRRPSSIQAFI